MGTRIHKMDAAQGFSAQGAGAAVILASTHYGFPLSTTQVISGGVMGSGAGKRLSAVRWGVAGNIVVAWILTFPAAAVIGAATYGVTRIFGTGALGPLVVTIAGLVILAVVVARRVRHGDADPGMSGLGLIGSIVDWGELGLTVAARRSPRSGSPPPSPSRSRRRPVQRARREGDTVAAAGAAVLALRRPRRLRGRDRLRPDRDAQLSVFA